MAQKVQVMLVCDLHDDEVEGQETVAFGLDGTSYEVDACEEHAAALRDAFAPFVGAARRAGRPSGDGKPQRRGSRGRSSDGGSGGGGSNKERTQAIRDWARSNGYKVSERGRLSGEVVAAYEAAHQS
ncbi:MAG: Lsr2 family protein [Actinomycetota bacterium]|nr:Lsr2 family protein [Actinomycetota bacterium]